MGVFNPGLLIDFDCDNFTDDIIVVGGSGFQTLATITLNVNSPTNTVWLNAYATWVGTNAAIEITFRFLRDGVVPLCSAVEDVDQAGQTDTTAFSCCDTDVDAGVHTYTLQALVDFPNATQSVTFTMGSLQGAVINT
jgi:hypothetical protein